MYFNMCGIIGFISNHQNCFNIIINGLKELQNRGYDSAGITTINNGNFSTSKYASNNKEDSLIKLESRSEIHKSKIGIGHTRWATHGAKTDKNAHPHSCPDNLFTLVHNGIIENYMEIKKFLIKNYDKSNFKSETDSEVIVNLLSYNYQNNKEISIPEVIKKTCSQLEGTWGLVILCSENPNCIYVTRKGSPILISKQENEVYIASEISGFCGNVIDYFSLKNNDVCSIGLNNSKIEFSTLGDIKYESDKKIIKSDFKQILYPFNHWMEKEIYEQIDSTLRAISLGGRILSDNSVKLGGLEGFKNELSKMDNILLLGCGTSFYACLLGEIYFRNLCDFKYIRALDGGEFDEVMIPKNGNTCIILLSQSGETRDLYRCIQIGRNKKCFLLGIVNVVDSQIARKVDCGVYLNAGREIGVASTKSFTSQCIVLSLVSIWFSQINNNIKTTLRIYLSELRDLSLQIESLFNSNEFEKLNSWAEFLKDRNSCFLLGKGDNIPITFEGALKLKEITYIHAESYSASSLKHGPLALINNQFPVIIFITEDKYIPKMINCYEELVSRNAKVLCITNSNDFKQHFISKNNNLNDMLFIDSYNSNYVNLLFNICVQKLAYNLSIIKGYNPDKPRNLAKVVTVE